MPHRRLPVLATGRLKLHNAGTYIMMRVLFDTGSEANLISEKCANQAKLVRKKYSIDVEGITGVQTVSYGLVMAQISPWFESDPEYSLFKTFIVMGKLPAARKTELNATVATTFNNVTRADPFFYEAGNTDLLLGIDTWCDIVRSKIIWSEIGLCAQMTSFGYAIFGTVKRRQNYQQQFGADKQ